MDDQIKLGRDARRIPAFVGKAGLSAFFENYRRDEKLVRLLELAGILDVASCAWLCPITQLGVLAKPVAHVGHPKPLDVEGAIAASNEIPGLFTERSGYFPAPGISGHLVCTIGSRSVGRAALFMRPRHWHASMRARLNDTIERIRRLVETVWIMFSEMRGEPEPLAMSPGIDEEDSLQSLVEQCPFGMLVLDIDHAIHVANGPARQLLDTADAMSLVSNRFVINRSNDAIRFQVALRAALAGVADRKVIAIAGNDGVPLLLSISRMSASLGEARACVMITRAGAVTEPDIEPLAEHFSLTQVEIRLVRHLVKGLNVQETAKALQLKVDTVRTYLKQIFQKTGTHRQVELLQLVQNGALPVL